MRRATLACASLMLLAGLTACGGDDSSEDADSGETTSSASPTESTSSSEEESSSTETTAPPTDTESESESPETDPANAEYCAARDEADDAVTLEDLRTAVDKLEDSLPDDAPDAAEEGLEYLQEEVQSAKTLDAFSKSVSGASKDEMAKVEAYGTFEDDTCDSAESPSDSSS